MFLGARQMVSLQLGVGEVHLWLIPHDMGVGQEAGERILSGEECRRVHEFVRAEDKQRYVQAHTAKRMILSRYLDCAPDLLAFKSGDNGRPDLVCGRLSFNLSHANGVSLLGVSRSALVGVDIEDCRRQVDCMALAKRFFSTEEVRYLADQGSSELISNAFFRIWTGKEAYVKYLGSGLGYGLSGFALKAPVCREVKICDAQNGAVPVLWVMPGQEGWGDYVIACCADRGAEQPRIGVWPRDEGGQLGVGK